MVDPGGGDPHVEGPTYFADFIRVLEERYAYASVAALYEEIDYIRSFPPARAALERRIDGVFILKCPIGGGDFAVIELELDVDGELQPVMGGFLRGKP